MDGGVPFHATSPAHSSLGGTFFNELFSPLSQPRIDDRSAIGGVDQCLRMFAAISQLSDRGKLIVNVSQDYGCTLGAMLVTA
jgi:hypothetical protein